MSISNSILLLVDNYMRQKFGPNIVNEAYDENTLIPMLIPTKENSLNDSETSFIQSIITPSLKNDNIRTLQYILTHDDDHCNTAYVVFIVKNNFRAACVERLNKFVENFLKFDEERARLFIEYIFNCKSDESITDIILDAMHYKVDTLKTALASLQKPVFHEIEGPTYMFDNGEYKQTTAYTIKGTAPYYKIITDSFLKMVTNVIKKLHFVALTSEELATCPLPPEYIASLTDELSMVYESDDESDL